MLVSDGIGYVKRSEAETSVLFELIAHGYEAGSLLITYKQPFSSWDIIFPDDMMAVAAVDRLIHHAHVVELSGEETESANTPLNEANPRPVRGLTTITINRPK